MTEPCRIGLVTPAWPGSRRPNGIATCVHHLAAGLRAIGHDPVILALSVDGPAHPEVPHFTAGPPRSIWDRLRIGESPIRARQRRLGHIALGAGRRARRAHGLDAVICEETLGLGGWLQARLDIPVVSTLHGPWFIHRHLQSEGDVAEDDDRVAVERRAMLDSAGLLAPSQNVMQATLDAYPELRGRPHAVIRNALLARDMPPPQDRARDILFVGRYDRHKGGDLVLQAFERAAPDLPGTRLIFAGVDAGLRREDGTVRHVRDHLDSLPQDVRARVTFTGVLSRDDLGDLRRRTAIALVASRYENLNYTLLEAMEAGQAIVSTDVGGPAEVLQDRVTGLLVPPDDPDAIAEALAELVRDAALRERLGHAARTAMEQDFDPRVIAARTVEFVRAL